MLGQLVKNVKIEGIDASGVPFGRFEGGTILTEKALPGDIADLQVLRLTKGPDALYLGRILEIRHPSPDRIPPFCEHFMHCGGCQWQQTSYENQLLIKRQMVSQLLQRHLPEGGITPAVVPSPLQLHYRNKIVFTFSNRRWMTPEEKSNPDTIKRPAAGYLMKGKYDHTLEINACHLAPESAIKLLTTLRDAAIQNNIPFYDMRKEKGILRQLMVRYGNSGRIMAGLVFGEFNEAALDFFIATITAAFPEVDSICYFINPTKDGNLSDMKATHAWGSRTLPVTINGLEFEMHPGSFFQTNTLQTAQLYQLASDWCELSGQENVFDLYSGTGTIALTVARKAGKVLGLEFVSEAVEQAKINAKRNNISNASFLAGDLKNLMMQPELSVYGKPDVVITDPPRSGMHRDVNQSLIRLLPQKIIYISCNPKTQERDIRILGDHYRLEKIQPFDMFPHTSHVENVAQLVRRD